MNFTLKKIKAGDILISLEGSKCTVLARVSNLIARSGWDNPDHPFSEWLTIAEAEKRKYRLFQDGKYPVSKEEAEEWLGVKIIS